ncbi:hypothetical protein Acy02nite_89800 [Actinoplanes cyaneus]|uniref:Uncharacterized protein n=1 Tax=Actinoplanes cyaneus TaxID=52696 RepID=A0A919IS15_9ACTN|nr:hypothetical protein Acy02nite_89800 [Actinoplanes cyaneus]
MGPNIKSAGENVLDGRVAAVIVNATRRTIKWQALATIQSAIAWWRIGNPGLIAVYEIGFQSLRAVR